MSRALSKDVVAALKNSDPSSAYREISEALSKPPSDGLLAIEILGSSYPIEPGTNLLRDGKAVAVPRFALVQAFLMARQVLKSHQESEAHDPPEPVLAATAVILLMDPEHLTAANTRKRLLQHATGDSRIALAARERHLIDSLLTSHLHRHTKSPTLWNHRRWLVELPASSGVPVDILGDIVNVVMPAGERHPRNYYAWCHARWLIDFASRPGNQQPGHDVEAERGRILTATKDWCYRHHTDISGWTFLYFLLFGTGSASFDVRSSTVEETMKLAASLRWDNESVWAFLRTAISSRSLGQTEYAAFIVYNRTLRDALSIDSTSWEVLRRAEEWSERYREAS